LPLLTGNLMHRFHYNINVRDRN